MTITDSKVENNIIRLCVVYSNVEYRGIIITNSHIMLTSSLSSNIYTYSNKASSNIWIEPIVFTNKGNKSLMLEYVLPDLSNTNLDDVNIIIKTNYIDSNGEKQTPIVIHRAIFGTFDRFTAFILEETKGAEFRRIKDRITFYGEQDSELRKAIQYRKNFTDALEQMASYDNYDKLINKLNQIKNPIKFYEYVNQSTTIKDLMEYYRDKATSQTYGGFASNQDAFNHGLEELGIL